MGWFGKITFGTLGLFLGGPLGAIAGAAMGHLLVDKGIDAAGRAIESTGEPRIGHAEQTQATYFISLFSILGNLAKVDGRVSKEEAAVVDAYLSSLQPVPSPRLVNGDLSAEARRGKAVSIWIVPATAIHASVVWFFWKSLITPIAQRMSSPMTTLIRFFLATMA